MNILYVCDEYPPVRYGGIGSVVKLVAEAMAVRGHKVFVAGNYAGFRDIDDISIINGVEIYRFTSKYYKTPCVRILLLLLWLGNKSGIRIFSNKFRFWIAALKHRITEKKIEKLIQQCNIDIIEIPDFNDALLHDLNYPVKHKKYQIPIVIRVHGSVSFLKYYFGNSIPQYILKNDKANLLRADAICAVSNFSAEFVKNNLIDKDIDVIYNPIENAVFTKRDNLATNRDILFFGKIIETKGAFSLIKAFNIVAGIFTDARLIMIGSGESEKAKILLDDTIAERVIFKGFMNNADLLKEIDKAFICVLPSYIENFSMAALEVLARSCPLIYSERSSGKELINDGENGWLINPEDPQQIADTIIYAFEHPEETAQIARAGYGKCKSEFSTEVIIPQLEKYYQNIIDNKTK